MNTLMLLTQLQHVSFNFDFNNFLTLHFTSKLEQKFKILLRANIRFAI